VWAVVRPTLIRAAIALAVTSIFVTLLLFRLGAPLAAVFELSVCAGLITVIFMSAISFIKPMTYQEAMAATKGRIRRFWYLPVIVAVAAFVLARMPFALNFPQPAPATDGDVRSVLWNLRQLELIGQILVLLIGVFAVVVLFKDKPKSGSDI
jgi:NADH-quinone oxidoreductase subunit J